MAGCMPCFIIPLLLFIFHKFIQPLILKFWNPWGDKAVKNTEDCKFNCECSWSKNKAKDVASGDQKTNDEITADHETKEILNEKEKVS